MHVFFYNDINKIDGENHVCGNNGWIGPRLSQNTQLTGPVVKTFKSGETVNMTAFVI